MFDLIILLIVIKIIISVANRNKTGKKKDASARQENTGLAVFPLEMPENGHRNGCRRRKG